ncbi:MAG TPA: CBS domain-containing protein [Gemmatimonadaceae bacterium]|nr:CBS domain-containing protein [Gemmatimonadaceae bacterium]
MLRVRDIMTADVVAVSPELSLRDAMELLAKCHVSGAPVVAAGRVVGVISATDLMAFAASTPGVPTERLEQAGWDERDEGLAVVDAEEEQLPSYYFSDLWADAGADVGQRFERTEGPEWNVLEEHTVAEAMTASPVFSLPPTATVTEAAERMRHAGVHRLLIMEGEALRGIVSAMDITRTVADHGLAARRYVFNRGRDFDDRGADEEG